MINSFAVGYEGEDQRLRAEELATRLGLAIENEADNQLLVTADKLLLKIHPFLPLHANFSSTFWQKRRDAGKKQGLVRACKPVNGLRIVDATAGWGRDAAVLASFGADVLMLEQNPVMAALLQDALERRDTHSKAVLKLGLLNVDARKYLESLSRENYPDVIYIDPMHPARQKAALVKKDLQILQQLIDIDDDVLSLIHLAQTRAKKVVVKWPQQLSPLLKPMSSVDGKTVRFDIYHAEIKAD
ncbi:MAG: class I SAM-dependent methyltransferase [Legionella sp.]|nr:class I SAM-dependent methyltransferase [Legionella sp.]